MARNYFDKYHLPLGFYVKKIITALLCKNDSNPISGSCICRAIIFHKDFPKNSEIEIL